MLNYFFKKFIIKEKACYVGLYFEEELKIVEPFDYESPNGTHIIVKDQRIRCHEALFKPAMIGKKEMVLVKLAMTLFKTVILVLEKIYTIVFLSGGNSMYNGLPERLTKEIKALDP